MTPTTTLPPAPAEAPDLTVAVTVTVKADDADLVSFLSYLGLGGECYSDVFDHNTCGYWMRGMDWNKARGWLAWESGDEDADPTDAEQAEAARAWAAGQPLPAGWFALDRAAAYKAVEAGIKRNGWPAFCDGTADAADYDCAIQIALLGEVKYG
jgi:hypothetical protein